MSSTAPAGKPFASPAWAEWIGARLFQLQWLAHTVRRQARTEPKADDDLLRRAAAYDTTQPSYAADLRAAALRPTQPLSR